VVRAWRGLPEAAPGEQQLVDRLVDRLVGRARRQGYRLPGGAQRVQVRVDAAQRSLLAVNQWWNDGVCVVVVGARVARLARVDQEFVLAHELAHLFTAPVRPRWIRMAGMALAFTGVAAMVVLPIMVMLAPVDQVSVFAAYAGAVVMVPSGVAVIQHDQRARELLADSFAVDTLGAQLTAEGLRLLVDLDAGSSRFRPRWTRSHPSPRDRYQLLHRPDGSGSTGPAVAG
jgi:Zn-dependent protease with chaperone function